MEIYRLSTFYPFDPPWARRPATLRLFGSRSGRRIRAWPGRLADRDTAITAMVMAAAVMAVAYQLVDRCAIFIHVKLS